MTAAKKQNVIIVEVKLDMFRFENGDSKEKIRRDVGLHEAEPYFEKPD